MSSVTFVSLSVFWLVLLCSNQLWWLGPTNFPALGADCLSGPGEITVKRTCRHTDSDSLGHAQISLDTDRQAQTGTRTDGHTETDPLPTHTHKQTLTHRQTDAHTRTHARAQESAQMKGWSCGGGGGGGGGGGREVQC